MEKTLGRKQNNDVPSWRKIQPDATMYLNAYYSIFMQSAGASGRAV
jgi:hypothetical protein